MTRQPKTLHLGCVHALAQSKNNDTAAHVILPNTTLITDNRTPPRSPFDPPVLQLLHPASPSLSKSPSPSSSPSAHSEAHVQPAAHLPPHRQNTQHTSP